MKTIMSIVFFLAGYFPVWAQITVLTDNADDGCKIKFEKIKLKIEARRKKYEFNVQEYKDGLFCSECGRTKSEIEERAHLNFEQHIRDGAAHNRHALVATRELYDNLYSEYLIDFNDLKKEYDDKYNDCGGDGSSSMLQAISDQQFQLYTIKLGEDTWPYNQLFGMQRIEYNFYYAWVMRISIIRWQTVGFKTTYKVRSDNASDAISQAGNMLNNCIQTLVDKQHAIFLEAGTRFSLAPGEVFTIK
ncbi:hypothetical protein [Mucilaginibacter sp. FT3.2]|uniref:hypothetical protein n=1 Tax=Mucilaginibacter sp. FT3.2 TaxID=2723090 RepID=UPI001615FCF5|nr:hypothetical protein [Mucilaginibacter sp. FT3.2]MBB6231836.1 hypothetical protein [Mucilaginibacter sp. FT3.2]